MEGISMKKMQQERKGIALHRETLRSLAETEVRAAVGGSGLTVGSVCDTCGRATCRC
jgi:hypothetical protein